MKREDLLEANGEYNRRNRWNIRSDGESPGCAGAIAHLLRANNTLEAIVMLVVDSTILVLDPKNTGKYLTKYQDRLPYIPKVSKESAGRNSDPVVSLLSCLSEKEDADGRALLYRLRHTSIDMCNRANASPSRTRSAPTLTLSKARRSVAATCS